MKKKERKKRSSAPSPPRALANNDGGRWSRRNKRNNHYTQEIKWRRKINMSWIEGKKGKTSRNDLLMRLILHNTAPITCKATLYYKSLSRKELKEAERTQKSIKGWRRAACPSRGLFLSKHWLTNAGTVRLPGRGHFLSSLELVCPENSAILVRNERLNRKSRMFFQLGNNSIHPRTC